MATLYIRARDTGDGRRFDVRYRRGGRYSKVEHGGTFRTKREAMLRLNFVADCLAAAKDPKRELDRAVFGDARFRHVHDEWLASRHGVGDSTLAGYRSRQSLILDEFGDIPVDQITVRQVIAWVGKLDGVYKPGTVRKYVTQLRLALDFADVPNVARDRKVELPRVVTAEPVPPDRDDVVRILEGVGTAYKLPVIVMEQLGVRVSEALALQPRDVDTSGGVLRLARERTKGARKGRTIEAPGFVIDALADRLPFRAMDRNSVNYAMRFSGYSPHTLRHRRATLWHQQGVEAVELARRLGHAKPSMSLDVYANVTRLQEVPPDVLAAFLR